MTERPESPEIVMVVDDQPLNLKLLEYMLSRQGYVVQSFVRGDAALAAAEERAPDVILLDINMPEMDGFEVCRRLKENPKLASLPVIFLSAVSDPEDKVKAFRAGGVDFITKPFHIEEVQARVETHLALQRTRRAERELLEQTLNGAIRTLADLVQLTAPVLSDRSKSIRSLVVHMATHLRVEDMWQYELGAILCLIGCISMPVEAFERAYLGESASPEEQRMFGAHPDIGSRLLVSIPRLEDVSAMIRLQQTEIANPKTVAERGASMLRVATEVDRRLVKGMPLADALSRLRLKPKSFPPEMLAALDAYSPPVAEFEIRRLPVGDLRSSMVLEDDLLTLDGKFKILQKGTTLNQTLVERVHNFAATRGVRPMILVRIRRAEEPPEVS